MQAIQGRLLVELRGAYNNITTTEERFGTSKIRGVVKSIAADIQDKCQSFGISEGSTVYFGKYEDTASFAVDGKDYAFIKLEEMGGVE